MAAYERALERVVKVLEAMAKLDLAGQLLMLRTRKAELIVAAVEAGLGSVTLPGDTVRHIKTAIADELGKITVPDNLSGLANPDGSNRRPQGHTHSDLAEGPL